MSDKKSSTESLTEGSPEERNVHKKSEENIDTKPKEMKKVKSSEKMGKAESLEGVGKSSKQDIGSKAVERSKSTENIGKGMESQSRENLLVDVKSTDKIVDSKTSKEDLSPTLASGKPSSTEEKAKDDKAKGTDSRRSDGSLDSTGFSMAFAENSFRSRSTSDMGSIDGKIEISSESEKGQPGKGKRVNFNVPHTMDDDKITRQASPIDLLPQRIDSIDSSDYNFDSVQ